MKNKILILITLLLGISAIAKAQQHIPKAILPGQTYNVNSARDTLWILTNSQFKKSIIWHKELKITEKQVKTQNQIIDSLKKIDVENKILVDTLKNDRNFYKNNWQKAENDVTTLANMNNKCSKHLKIAIIVGGATTVAAFFAGIFSKL